MYQNIDALEKLTFGGLKNGLWNVKKILKELWNPHKKYQVFHVAGTNGKGSVCQMISQVLAKGFGYKVGLTLSPHLIRLNERIQINSEQISDQMLDAYLWKVFSLTGEMGISLSFFESMIVSALRYFAQQHVDYAVIEVWLGGTYDATNVFDHPLATIITTISNDHKDLLGPKLSQILRNKAGILKRWTPCFTRLETPLMQHIARMKKSPLVISSSLQETSLPGAHQEANAWLTYDCLSYLGFDEKISTTELLHIAHPGRCQRLTPNVLLDGAHNAEWVQALKAYVETIQGRYNRMIAVFWATKTCEQYPDFFAELLAADLTYAVKPIIVHRAVDPENYISQVAIPMTNAGTLENVRADLPRNDPETLIVIYGSLYLIGEVLQKAEKEFKNKTS